MTQVKTLICSKGYFQALFKPMLVLLLLMTCSAALADDLGCNGDYVKLKKNSQVILVSPNGFNDTFNIQCALDAAIRDGYPTVELTAGTFYTGGITVENFNGTLEGTTRASTIVETLNEVIDCTAMVNAGRAPSVFKFINGEPRIRFMTIKAGHACIDDETPLHYLFHFTGAAAYVDNCDNEVIFASMDRVSLMHFHEAGVPRIAVGVFGEGVFFDTCKTTLLGTFKFNRSSIEDYSIGVLTSMRGAAQVDINFNEFSGNHIAIVLQDTNQNTTITTNTINGFSNAIRSFSGVLISAFPLTSPKKTRVIIDNNDFNIASSDNPGIAVEVYETYSVNVSSVISNNHFNLSGDMGSGLVFSGVSNATVSTNRFSGSGQRAIYAGALGAASGWTITSNTGLAGFHSNGGADIVLDTNTSDCFVGADQGAVVNNMGSGNTVLPQ